MGHGPATFVGRLASHRQNLRNLFRREFASPTTPGRIAPYAFDSTLESRCLLATLDQRQPLEGPDPTAPPNADGVPSTAEFFGDGFVVFALKGSKNHAGSLGYP
jgi:hypothetical protein